MKVIVAWVHSGHSSYTATDSLVHTSTANTSKESGSVRTPAEFKLKLTPRGGGGGGMVNTVVGFHWLLLICGCYTIGSCPIIFNFHTCLPLHLTPVKTIYIIIYQSILQYTVHLENCWVLSGLRKGGSKYSLLIIPQYFVTLNITSSKI